jgi:hypothetical protein
LCAGHLEGLENRSGAFEVEGIVGQARHDFAEGDLKVCAIGYEWQGERDMSFGASRGTARWVVVVAVLLAAERGGTAAFAGGVEVGTDWERRGR